jgi:tetratricopeptide (TPR) repeat protein
MKEPGDVQSHRARVYALQGLGREREATVAMETLFRMGDLKAKDLLRLGDLYHNLNLYELSLLNYQRAIERKEKLSIGRYVRAASILMNRGSYNECFLYLDKIEEGFGGDLNDQDQKDVLLLKHRFFVRLAGQLKQRPC